MIRVVFVSDQPLSALGLRTLLRGQPDVELVTEFTSEDNVLDGNGAAVVGSNYWPRVARESCPGCRLSLPGRGGQGVIPIFNRSRACSRLVIIATTRK